MTNRLGAWVVRCGAGYLIGGAWEGSMLEALADPLTEGSSVLYALEGDAVLLHPLLVTSWFILLCK